MDVYGHIRPNNYHSVMYKNFKYPLIAIFTLLILVSCKKKKDETASPVIFTPDKSVALFSNNTSIKDSLYVLRTKATANFKVSANVKTMGVEMKRLYIFNRIIDDVNAPGNYTSVEISGYTLDANNNYYLPLTNDHKDSTINEVSVALRVNSTTAIIDEFYFVYTDDNDYAGPATTTGVVIGPAQFFVIYGKLTEHKGIKIYNSATNLLNVYAAFDMENITYRYLTDSDADIDIAENTDDSPLFLGKFKARNSTTFVKAPANFPYTNATDTQIKNFYLQGTPFTETPDSVKIGDVYLMQLRGNPNAYATIKVVYTQLENGKTGAGFDNEYFILNMKK
jgi:hypothetical protein